MIDHVWTVVCSRAEIDQRSNNLSLQNVIEQLTIKDKPKPGGGVLIPLHVVTMWARADFDVPSQGRGRLVFLSPSGQIRDPLEFLVDLSEFKRARTQVEVQGLGLEEPGRYTFLMELQNEGESEWRQVAAIPLEVIFAPPEIEQTESEPE